MNNVDITNAVTIVMENKEEFAAAFPELEKPLKLLSESKDKPGCSSCARKKYERDIMTVIMLTDKKDRNLDRLLLHQDPQLLGALTYQPTSSDLRPAPDESMPALSPIKLTYNEELMRDGCPDCVCKHLSQALILSDEIVQGYPEHTKLALEHTRRAVKYSTGKNKKTHNLLRELQTSFENILEGETVQQTPEFYLSRARAIMKEMLEDNMSHPLSVWRIIGHLGEAADECVTDDPVLAGHIREERLALMEDHMYRPPLAKLLNDARKGRG